VRIRHARIIVAAGAAIAALAILLLSRNFNFYFDEWDFILAAPDWTWLSFLGSTRASYITGQVLSVNGGLAMLG